MSALRLRTSSTVVEIPTVEFWYWLISCGDFHHNWILEISPNRFDLHNGWILLVWFSCYDVHNDWILWTSQFIHLVLSIHECIYYIYSIYRSSSKDSYCVTVLWHKINLICINMLFYVFSEIKRKASKYGICSDIWRYNAPCVK